ncbi:hypothetical protein F5B22DRAFT_104120 [Xylaria bambusicola]|uniref:uncharacterized protein n=1 Tax=Xylaria bambusicola TaxID=326684 RepID=UPI002008A71B|nr:uncharacterized protein F5B22DRAFT_104120 [Xylaria bambusicola]KAI0502719.1 hypothetical protein F5B22DRAFT_104120 [Xylaria bambusicola]
MSDRNALVATWICSLPENVAKDIGAPSITTKKRKRPPQLTSPPASVQEEMPSTPKKRRRMSATDPETTPRPRIPGSSIPRSNTAGSTTSSSHTSHISSRASSPKKQMLNLRLHEPVLEFNALSLNLNALPPAARELVEAMTEIGSNQDILPHAAKSSIMESVNARDPMPRLWRYAFKSAEDDGDALLPRRIPCFREVEKICRKANECQQYDHEEVSWNCSVHARLLELILEDEDGRPCSEFDAMICTTVRLHPVWKPIWSPGKMIDICLYHISTSQDGNEDLHAKITQLSRLTPTGTINHTDFYPVSMRPIVLSIETKKPGVHWEAAQLQIGIWHAAQWAFLRWAVVDKLRRQSINDNGQGEGEGDGGNGIVDKSQAQAAEAVHDAIEVEVLSVMSKLGFIPGVIVQGHRWHLVLSTYEDRKTKLWADRQFGSTQTCLESYSVIAGIRRLTAWARDIYLPWFKLYILDND